MSEKLGPIHYHMFEKLKFQDVLAKRLLSSNLREQVEMNERFGSIPNLPMEEVLDEANIHGSLQELVNLAEQRLQFALAHAKDAEQTIYQAGRVAGAGKELKSADAIVKELEIFFLDGMPSSHAIKFDVLEDDSLQIAQNVDCHKEYKIEDGNMDFYQAREIFINGFLSETAYHVERIGEQAYWIKKR